MAKIYTTIPKFKRIELSLRETIIAHRKVIDEIDKALSSNRTDEERKLLHTIRQECLELQKKSRELHANFYVSIEDSTSGK